MARRIHDYNRHLVHERTPHPLFSYGMTRSKNVERDLQMLRRSAPNTLNFMCATIQFNSMRRSWSNVGHRSTTFLWSRLHHSETPFGLRNDGVLISMSSSARSQLQDDSLDDDALRMLRSDILRYAKKQKLNVALLSDDAASEGKVPVHCRIIPNP